mgnify:CR=1 FL=1
MSDELRPRPDSIVDLLGQLPEVDEHLKVNLKAKLVITHEELGTLSFTGAEVYKILATIDTTAEFFDALQLDGTEAVEVYNYQLTVEVKETMERRVEYVDEA